MDLALAHALAAKLGREGHRVDRWQLTGLTHAAREAKEALFADPRLAEHPVAVPGRGSSLVGGALRTALTRAELDAFRRHLHTTARLLRDLSDVDSPNWRQATEEYDRSWAEVERARTGGESASP